MESIKHLVKLDGIGAYEVLGITEERGKQMQLGWEAMVNEIASNTEDYSYNNKGKSTPGINVGMCLNKMLQEANNIQEELYCLMNLDIFIEKILHEELSLRLKL